MVRIFLTITKEQMEELKNHLLMNGYNVEWETDDVITVDIEEVSYIETILNDRGIKYGY